MPGGQGGRDGACSRHGAKTTPAISGGHLSSDEPRRPPGSGVPGGRRPVAVCLHPGRGLRQDRLAGSWLWRGAQRKRGGQGGAVGGVGIERGGVEAIRFGVAAQGRPGEDRPGAAFAAGNDDAGQMDLRAAGDGIVEIRQPEAL